jgi:hypothetical protein
MRGKEMLFRDFLFILFFVFESTAREIVTGWRESRYQPFQASKYASFVRLDSSEAVHYIYLDEHSSIQAFINWIR